MAGGEGEGAKSREQRFPHVSWFQKEVFHKTVRTKHDLTTQIHNGKCTYLCLPRGGAYRVLVVEHATALLTHQRHAPVRLQGIGKGQVRSKPAPANS
jgi:hypothetical protein